MEEGRSVVAPFATLEGCTPAFGRVVSHPCRKERVMDGAPGGITSCDFRGRSLRVPAMLRQTSESLDLRLAG
jgi:hypothetical protein